MKLHSDTSFGQNMVTAYGPDHVAINGRRYSQSVVLTRESIESDFPARIVGELTPELLAPHAAHKCDVFLIGTGSRQSFPPPQTLRPLIMAGVGVEVMDTAAACRTYNILVAEGRNPLALLLVEAP